MISDDLINDILEEMSQGADIDTPKWVIADVEISFFDHATETIYFSRSTLEAIGDDMITAAALVVHEWRHWWQFVKGFCQASSEACSDAREVDAVEFVDHFLNLEALPE